MSQSERIIALFGGQTRLAGMLKINQSVVAGWKSRGVIPAARHGEVLRAAQANQIPLTPLDFFEPADIAPLAPSSASASEAA